MATDILGIADILGENDNDLLGAEVILGSLDDVDDLLGVDDDDLLGARGRPGAYQNPAMMRAAQARGMSQRQKQSVRSAAQKVRMAAGQVRQQAVQQALANRGTVVRDIEPTRSRHLMLNFDTVATVAAGANVQLVSRPQVVFRPERLLIGGAFAPSFIINDIKVGKNSQFVNSAAAPGDAFGPTAFGVELQLDTCQISMDIVLDVTNISGAALRFIATMFGRSIE